ncbi:tellurite resistance TerB family protein [Prochlorothrix hollandica]|uniref:Tellurite resistance protein TerB n=1 Tax=Prochlorothrix hollandica PCC 9006 = CALU 1027 TaxID=317619 RepID=A0A0M2PY29_PROHO|nr:tellurite resistance TerB family protein [Prochlorothrix hollandica]KKI99987.1 Tellurite resistance protein TerB [Prochlorothrix hollandica PCC 9006 = CALU 1027]
MGLFDKGVSAPTPEMEKLNAGESFAAIALAAVASDGYLSDEEAQSIPFILSRMKLFQTYSDDMMRRLFDKLLGRLKRGGVSALFLSAKDSLPEHLRQTAFAVATDLVLADGVVTPEEKAFLDELYQVLEMPEETAKNIIDVMLIKNQG